MSVAQFRRLTVRYRWCFGEMIPWYRQAIALIFGLGVMLIALWAIEQGQGMILITSVAGMAFVALLLIFGVEIDSIQVDSIGLSIDFSNTTVTKTRMVREDDHDGGQSDE